MSLGERITELRNQNNLSQYELAKAMEVSRQAVSKWENDQSSPDARNLIRLADILDTDIEYLTTGRRTYGRRPPVVLKMAFANVAAARLFKRTKASFEKSNPN